MPSISALDDHDRPAQDGDVGENGAQGEMSITLWTTARVPIGAIGLSVGFISGAGRTGTLVVEYDGG